MNSTSNKEYCVNWKNHMSHVRQAFDSLLCSNELTDVMIYCEGKKVSAHRMVLSACSAYFREIFKNNPYQNPIIVIPGVEYAVLTDIIRFIYQGEVSVDTAKLDMFLKTAQLLQISGLTEKANDRVINEIEKRENAERLEAQHLEEDTATAACSSVSIPEETRRGNKRIRSKDTTEFVREKSSRRQEIQHIDDESILLTDVKCEPGEFIDFDDHLVEDPLLQNENEHKEYVAVYEANSLPENVLVADMKANDSIIPKKSMGCYEKEYVNFEKWTEANSVKVINDNVILSYFQELAESYSPNSLWTKFSMLRKELIVKEKIKSSEKFVKLQAYLKEAGKGYRPKKSKVLTREQVVAFLREAPVSQYLLHKVALLMGVFGACRRDELVKMKFTDVRDVGTHIVVNIPSTNTEKGRSFFIVKESEMEALTLIRNYISLRPAGASNDRFFLNFRGNRCTTQPVGKNTLGSIPSQIATYLGLPDPTCYTGHCLRRTSATLHFEAGGSTTDLMKLGGSVVKEYIDDNHYSMLDNFSTEMN